MTVLVIAFFMPWIIHDISLHLLKQIVKYGT
jgi:hypothetical protein